MIRMSRFKSEITNSDFLPLMFWTRYDLDDLLKMPVTSGIKLVHLRKGETYFTGTLSWESPAPHDVEAFLYFPWAQ